MEIKKKIGVFTTFRGGSGPKFFFSNESFPKVMEKDKDMDKVFKSVKQSHFHTVVIQQFSSSLLTYFLKSKTPRIPFGKSILMYFRVTKSIDHFPIILNDLLNGHCEVIEARGLKLCTGPSMAKIHTIQNGISECNMQSSVQKVT